MSITNNLLNLKDSLPDNISLVAVSKTKPIDQLYQAYNSGQKIFGENKIQEMTAKWEVLPKDIEWHMIGHVQSNKVKYMAPYVSMIHTVDSLKLLKEINKQASKNNRIIDCLLQVHISDDTKFGLDEVELELIINTLKNIPLSNIVIRGLMGMATFTSDHNQILKEFNTINLLFKKYKSFHTSFNQLSIGMSGDYLIAIESGSTLIRIGSKVFGERN
tara:strand:+ start:291 stop:941 length:651 start_codon:yes stop_codon:yes gene_type:complete